MNEPHAVTASVRIAATPAEVYPYFTDASLLARWMGSAAEASAQPGGVFAVDVGQLVKGQYVDLDPPHRVVFTWGLPGNDVLPPGGSTVEVRLTADGDETVVELRHDDLPADLRADHLAGWTSLLDRLVAACASRRAPESPVPTEGKAL